PVRAAGAVPPPPESAALPPLPPPPAPAHTPRPSSPYAIPAQLLAGRPGGRFVDVPGRAGPPFGVARVGRGLAAGDLDNDGRVDALILSQNEPLASFHNQTVGGHFVTFRLEGTGSERDGVRPAAA